MARPPGTLAMMLADPTPAQVPHGPFCEAPRLALCYRCAAPRTKADAPMTRRRWLARTVALTMVPWRVFAQKTPSIPHVGLLWVDLDGDSTNLAALREGLRAQRYIEGKTIHLDRGSLVDRYERLPDAVDRLIANNVDLIVCYGATATLAARKATAVVPIVSVTGGDPVTLGLAASLSRP